MRGSKSNGYGGYFWSCAVSSDATRASTPVWTVCGGASLCRDYRLTCKMPPARSANRASSMRDFIRCSCCVVSLPAVFDILDAGAGLSSRYCVYFTPWTLYGR